MAKEGAKITQTHIRETSYHSLFTFCWPCISSEIKKILPFY
jgi:hypothetical protein